MKQFLGILMLLGTASKEVSATFPLTSLPEQKLHRPRCHRGTLEEMADWILWADKVIVF